VTGIVNAEVLILLPQLPRRNYWIFGLILQSDFHFWGSDISKATGLSENFRTKIGRFLLKLLSGYRACVPQGQVHGSNLGRAFWGGLMAELQREKKQRGPSFNTVKYTVVRDTSSWGSPIFTEYR
jgi:hypothetical protein